MKIGIALSGGGARGIMHLGVFKALEELGVKIEVISGTSAGAIAAAMYAYGMSPHQIFEHVSHLSLFKSVRPSWSWAGLLIMSGLRDLIIKTIPENNFSVLKIPLTIAATEIRKGEAHYFTSGELAPAVVASCSIPAMFNPLHFDEHMYVDGGLLDNLPTRCIRQQCELLIGSHCNKLSQEFDARNLKVVIERTMLLAIDANTRQSKQLCDIVIEPPNMDRFTVFDMSKAQEIFDAGYQFTIENFNVKQFQKKDDLIKDQL